MPYKLTCLECHGSYTSRQFSSDFCCTACRRTFNNRRAQRGAALYDLIMIEATDPEAFQKARLDGTVEAMVSEFVAEDKEAGRKRSHKSLTDVRSDMLRYQS